MFRLNDLASNLLGEVTSTYDFDIGVAVMLPSVSLIDFMVAYEVVYGSGHLCPSVDHGRAVAEVATISLLDGLVWSMWSVAMNCINWCSNS